MAVIQRMDLGSVERALALINEEGWGFSKDEIERILLFDPEGSFISLEGNNLMGVVTCAAFGHTGVIGHLVVAKEARRKKIGQTLMQVALDHCDSKGCDSVVLYATEQGTKLYHKMGFSTLREGFCYHSLIGSKDFGPANNPCRRMAASDLDEVVDIDKRMFGDGRPSLIRFIANEFPDDSFVLERNGRMVGFAIGQPLDSGFNIGPWCCETGEGDADLLFRAVLRSLGEGDVYICGFPGNRSAVNLVRTLDPIRSWDVKFMVRGRERYPKGVENVFSVVSFEFG